MRPGNELELVTWRSFQSRRGPWRPGQFDEEWRYRGFDIIIRFWTSVYLFRDVFSIVFGVSKRQIDWLYRVCFMMTVWLFCCFSHYKFPQFGADISSISSAWSILFSLLLSCYSHMLYFNSSGDWVGLSIHCLIVTRNYSFDFHFFLIILRNWSLCLILSEVFELINL